MKPSRDVSRLIEIMAELRTPETGCPWDLEQTFETIAPYTLEEAYEVADAIHKRDYLNLREELGDLLLQVVYHARMAEEAGHFDFGNVVEGVTKKMIRRHPHVFGDETGEKAELVKGIWERIKAEERAEKAAERQALGVENVPPAFLDDVPTAFPALQEADKLQRRASKVGFDWNDPALVISKIREEAGELEEELDAGEPDKDRVADELGDMMFALANLARHLDIDPEDALRRTNRKFRNRFKAIEVVARETGTSLEDMPLEDMEAAWQAAKKRHA
ncbi:ATP diphosphatase [Roseibium hamelinense]|uniref:Nucleoside triphosphate pyrophosphohydrolase n=1 Tax=Roseibium hamelinense TaxID=150831 RepID=A0A562TH62_9HYPH|nr:nucleoside triphosphate pyrophosphohydrolase [Roseibium hamelinense]MTI45857.1 nucleoside triphosphate pyrophosphohydrolase [Roseibium hamelinense]TWI92961.1 ATP diphosphatase [Roseibium hamelinense]